MNSETKIVTDNSVVILNKLKVGSRTLTDKFSQQDNFIKHLIISASANASISKEFDLGQ